MTRTPTKVVGAFDLKLW